MNEKKLMNRAADNIRILAASMVEKANSGHPGGAMGGADFVNVLFSEFLVYDPENPRWEGRDRFFLDPGHMSPMLYSTLALTGKFTMEELAQFRQWGSPTPGHPEVDIMRGIENTSGPLGQGHTFAVGAAIAAKFLKARLVPPSMANSGSSVFIYAKYMSHSKICIISQDCRWLSYPHKAPPFIYPFGKLLYNNGLIPNITATPCTSCKSCINNYFILG